MHYEIEKKTNHLLHLVLSIFSFGFWAPIWLLVSVSVSLENSSIRRRNKKAKAMEDSRHEQLINASMNNR